MAKKSKRKNYVILKSSEKTGHTYIVRRSKNTPAKLKLKKYDPVIRKHVVFEAKS